MTRTLLRGGTVIDGTGAPPRPDTPVLLEEDRIVAVGAEGVAAVVAGGPAPDEVDVTGLTVMPGIIDSHCHSTLGEPASNDELFHHRDPAGAALMAAFNVRKLLLAGVTSFLDPDGLFNIGPALRDAIEAGMVEGPTMRAGGWALMTAVGGTAGRMIPESGTAGYAEVVRDRDEMITATRRQIKQGADVIKIHVTGSVPTKRGELQVWTLDELRTVCDTAHDLGVRVVAHCRGAGATRDAARAGVDIIFHASYMDEAALEAIHEAGSSLCPVFTFLANLAEHGAKAGSTSAVQDVFRREMEDTGRMMRRAYDEGVPLLAGSESGFSLTPYGHWHYREMEIFVEHLGLTPLEALTTGTKNGAIALDQVGEVGTIEAGLRADVLVLDGDPSRDVSLLGDRRRFRHLWCRGKEVDLSGPWPERRPLPGEKLATWSAVPLTWDLVHP
ncbi:amidohydrolase family protein [Acidimicrobiaceae bacterium USS-CC1]|uniref:Amidohydrolase family protein n=1 Tax=Acidiferrimicrobium australe TaxID=2664430 RepID=A0ABW9QZ08_9ACTN|nr:amidohydrolase family protein [Acidiferrimicrobium australe]